MSKPFRIDPEFERLHRKLTDEEQSQLWADLNERGILAPLIVWKEKSILLDGHNRHGWARLAGKDDDNLPIEFVSFSDRTSALRWVIRLQLARRNLTPDEASLLRGKAFNLEKRAPHDGGKGRKRSGDQNEPHFDRTATRLAKEHGVSSATIKRDGQFAAAVESIEKYVPEIKGLVENGRCPIPRAVVVEAAERIEVDPEFADELREQLQPKAPRPKTVKSPAPTPPIEEADLERERRFNRIRELAGDLFRASIGLEKIGREARSEYWLSSPTVREVSKGALSNVRACINTWLEETFK